MPVRTLIDTPRVVPIYTESDISLILDLKQRKVEAVQTRQGKTAGRHPQQSILIPEIDARENYDPVYRIIKRSIDIAFSVYGLVITAPLFLLISILIKITSRGPVFYMQERTGKGGRRFLMYKFRTMKNGSDRMKKELEKSSHLKWPDFKVKNDPRVTGVGRVLRKLSLDEIPNFINVIKGDMSLIGPRPTSFHADAYKDWHKLRLKATPGLTGLQQVSGRANLQFDDRVLLDIKYILYQSLTLDLYILFKTMFVVLTTRGSY